MQRSWFYLVFFAGILLSYIVKLRMVKRGAEASRSNVRDGIISGITAYMIYQTWAAPEVELPARIAETLLGVAALCAGIIFFIQAGKDSVKTVEREKI